MEHSTFSWEAVIAIASGAVGYGILYNQVRTNTKDINSSRRIIKGDVIETFSQGIDKLDNDINRISAFLQHLDIRLKQMEQYLEKKQDFRPVNDSSWELDDD